MNATRTEAGIFTSTWRQKYFLELPFAGACISIRIWARAALAHRNEER
ncbi:MAG: hypothetical protein QOD74_1182, partial [Variibacter sp.]|nr:hypothetical protein [Variibacter sp.]